MGDGALRRGEESVTRRSAYECPGCRGDGAPGPVPGSLPLVRCTGCGLVFRRGEDIDRTLDANAATFERMPRGWWESLYDGWNACARGAVLPRVSAPGKALEIGPGRGAFTALLLKEGYQVEGVDISEDICADMKRRFGVRMVHGTLDRFRGAGSFDLIAVHHVVEHIPEILSFLGKCRTLLAPGGHLIVSCPNLGSWSAAFRSWSGYESYHCLFFTPESLAALLERSGYAVCRIYLRQPFTGWWNVLTRSIVRGGRPDGGGTAGPQARSRAVRFLYNVARFAGSALLLPVTVASARMSRGEEIVALAVKIGKGPAGPAAGATEDRGSARR